MIVDIADDFDLEKIAHCGQCFRAKKIFGDVYRFITGKSVIYISRKNHAQLEVSCDEREWHDVWTNYFDLETNYRALRAEVDTLDGYLKSAADFGAGIRILRQEPFETLISFIISQRKSIPSITTSIERIANKFGRKVETHCEEINLFPTVEELSGVDVEQLSGLGLGYRKNYIVDAVNSVRDGRVNLSGLNDLDDEALIETLKTIKGVGDKVANCVALFAYHRVDRVPIDVWIRRAIEDDFRGHNFFLDIKRNAGIVQQYVFYHKRFRKPDSR